MKTVTAPIAPHDLPKETSAQIDDIVRRVTSRAVIEGAGHDLLLRVYMAGFYHGITLTSTQERDNGR